MKAKKQTADAKAPPRIDEALESEPVEAETYGEVVELGPGETVDGDWNGAPELAGLDESREWTGVDALAGMRGPDAQETDRSDDQPVARAAATLERERRELVERLESLREEVPDRVLASAAESILAGDDALSDAVRVAEELTSKIARIDEALARYANEGSRSSES
jgi:hypothetical protein